MNTAAIVIAGIFVGTLISTYHCHLSGNGTLHSGVTVTCRLYFWALCGINSPIVVSSYSNIVQMIKQTSIYMYLNVLKISHIHITYVYDIIIRLGHL